VEGTLSRRSWKYGVAISSSGESETVRIRRSLGH
jgi:hypothetical protein